MDVLDLFEFSRDEHDASLISIPPVLYGQHIADSTTDAHIRRDEVYGVTSIESNSQYINWGTDNNSFTGIDPKWHGPDCINWGTDNNNFKGVVNSMKWDSNLSYCDAPQFACKLNGLPSVEETRRRDKWKHHPLPRETEWVNLDGGWLGIRDAQTYSPDRYPGEKWLYMSAPSDNFEFTDQCDVICNEVGKAYGKNGCESKSLFSAPCGCEYHEDQENGDTSCNSTFKTKVQPPAFNPCITCKFGCEGPETPAPVNFQVDPSATWVNYQRYQRATSTYPPLSYQSGLSSKFSPCTFPNGQSYDWSDPAGMFAAPSDDIAHQDTAPGASAIDATSSESQFVWESPDDGNPSNQMFPQQDVKLCTAGSVSTNPATDVAKNATKYANICKHKSCTDIEQNLQTCAHSVSWATNNSTNVSWQSNLQSGEMSRALGSQWGDNDKDSPVSLPQYGCYCGACNHQYDTDEGHNDASCPSISNYYLDDPTPPSGPQTNPHHTWHIDGSNRNRNNMLPLPYPKMTVYQWCKDAPRSVHDNSCSRSSQDFPTHTDGGILFSDLEKGNVDNTDSLGWLAIPASDDSDLKFTFSPFKHYTQKDGIDRNYVVKYYMPDKSAGPIRQAPYGLGPCTKCCAGYHKMAASPEDVQIAHYATAYKSATTLKTQEESHNPTPSPTDPPAWETYPYLWQQYPGADGGTPKAWTTYNSEADGGFQTVDDMKRYGIKNPLSAMRTLANMNFPYACNVCSNDSSSQLCNYNINEWPYLTASTTSANTSTPKNLPTYKASRCNSGISSDIPACALPWTK